MGNFGLIGYPLSHSFSEKFFTDFFEKNSHKHHYSLFPIETIDELNNLISEIPYLIGLNVTIPHKISIIKYCSDLSKEAFEIGAVNCLKIERKNNKIQLIGHNTDCLGFEKSLFENYHLNTQKSAIILGNGGSSKAVQYILKKNKKDFITISSIKSENTFKWNEINKEMVLNSDLIINTTPVGMFPNIKNFVSFPFEFLSENHLFFDLIYNPEETKNIKKAKQFGAKAVNGLDMLLYQALASWDFWEL